MRLTGLGEKFSALLDVAKGPVAEVYPTITKQAEEFAKKPSLVHTWKLPFGVLLESSERQARHYQVEAADSEEVRSEAW